MDGNVIKLTSFGVPKTIAIQLSKFFNDTADYAKQDTMDVVDWMNSIETLNISSILNKYPKKLGYL